jgi:hypothetical protein
MTLMGAPSMHTEKGGGLSPLPTHSDSLETRAQGANIDA